MAEKLGLGDLQNRFAGKVAASPEELVAFQQAAIPRLTTAQRDALTVDQRYAGFVIYNTTTNKLNVRVAAGWEAVTSAAV